MAEEVKCPRCKSTNIQKQAGYAALQPEGISPQPAHTVPNECREEKCRHKWYNEE